MKKLDEIQMDFGLCRQQVADFQELLKERTDLPEREVVLPFFRDRPHLSLLLGMFNPRIGWADRIAWEFDMFGDFSCDLAVGAWTSGSYCFVEFEDARSESIFKQEGKRATRAWSSRFETWLNSG